MSAIDQEFTGRIQDREGWSSLLAAVPPHRVKFPQVCLHLEVNQPHQHGSAFLFCGVAFVQVQR